MSNFKFPVVFLIFLAIVSVLLLFLGLQVKVTKISCYTQYGPCPESYQERLTTLTGRLLYTVGGSEVKESLSALGVVGKVRVIKHLSGKIEVVVEVEKPRVAVNVGRGHKLLLVNLNGEIVSQVEASSLPKLSVGTRKISPEDSNFVSALRLVELSSRAVPVSSAQMSGEDLVFTTDTTQVLMPLSGREEQVLVGSLQLILTRSTIEGERPVKIDLRFKNAVATY